LLILISPYSAAFSLTPTFTLAAYKISSIFLVTWGVLPNPHLKNVRKGRTTAVFPEADGSFDRQKGDDFGGEGVCVMLLSTKCNHPLGMLYPPYQKLTEHGRAMFIDLETNGAEYGFLGYSTYGSTDDVTKPVSMSIMYFKTMADAYKYSHSKTHRAGWEWYVRAGNEVECVSIAHEIYEVPAGKWENIYVNAKPYGFAATSHAVKAEGKEVKWACPMIDGKRMGGKQRLATIKD
ncbi:Monooxygenase, partial [Lachnellula suecica]